MTTITNRAIVYISTLFPPLSFPELGPSETEAFFSSSYSNVTENFSKVELEEAPTTA